MAMRKKFAACGFLFLGLVAGLDAGTGVSGKPRHDSLVVSVVGQVSDAYHREKLGDGTYKPEQYVIADAGKYAGTTRDASFEKVKYPEVAGVVARHLASQKYFLAPKAKDATLLITIHWGTTVPFNDANYDIAVDRLGEAMKEMAATPSMSSRINAQTGEIAPGGGGVTGGNSTISSAIEFGMARVEMENRMRDDANEYNASILGYRDAINARREMISWADVGGIENEMVSDVEEERYYVVVTAYDFKAMQANRKKVPLWATRISISARGNSFDERMGQMVAAAASSLGRKEGLRRRFYGDPSVSLGELQILGEANSLPAPSKTN